MAEIPVVKSNIAKMIAQGAPEADIDAYLAGEGVSLEQLKAPKAPDKYQQTAIDEQADLKTKGIDPGAGLTRRLAHGATLGADSTILAAATTPLEMIRRGTLDPREGYNYAKAREDQIMGDARKNTGGLGTAAEVLGGGVTGAGLASGGITAARLLGPEAGLLARSGASAADAAGLGTFSGAMEGNGLAERGANALKGGILGGILGGATPGVLALGGAALSPVISNIRARINPEGFARSQVARGVSESGMTPAAIAGDIRSAANEGQGMFTAADAMGNAGQRMLSSTARSPGQARTDVLNFLDNRQAGQGRRIANTLAEGFEVPQTAAQTEARLTAQRTADADAAYGAVRTDAQPVDVSNALTRIDQTLAPYGVSQGTAAHDTAAAALASIRARLTGQGGKLNDFNAVQRVRGDLSDTIQQAVQSGANNKARLLRAILGELDTSLENSSAGFREANRNFAQASRDIEAVNLGRQAATRGRTEDVIPEFRAQSPQGRDAYRAGYVDPLIAQTQGAAFGVNKARPLINDAFQAEAAAMAPATSPDPRLQRIIGNPLMQRRIGREDTMFQTRNAAMGNSKTAENLADDAAMGVDPTVIGSLVTQIGTGNISGALRTMLGAGQNALTGNTPAVRQAVADILLTRGSNVNAAQFQRMLDETVARIQQVQQIARSMGRGAAGGLAVTGPGQNRR